MKRLENLNSLKKEQILSLEANRGTCIVSNMLDTPVFEFAVYESNGVTVLGIDDSKQVYVLPLSEAKKLDEYLSSNLHAPTLENHDNETKLEYVATIDMNLKERQQWETENCACVIEDDNGGVLELQKSYFYSTDSNGNKVPGSEYPTLSIAVCDDMEEKEIFFTVSSRNEIRKLRDYLNNYLEENF